MEGQEGFYFKYRGDDSLEVWQPEEQVCPTLGGGRQQTGSQHPRWSCAQHPSHEPDGCMVPPARQWRQRGLSWAEVALMVAGYLVFALFYPPQGEKTCLPVPRGLGVGITGAAPFPLTGVAQAQAMSLQCS